MSSGMFALGAGFGGPGGFRGAGGEGGARGLAAVPAAADGAAAELPAVSGVCLSGPAFDAVAVGSLWPASAALGACCGTAELVAASSAVAGLGSELAGGAGAFRIATRIAGAVTASAAKSTET